MDKTDVAKQSHYANYKPEPIDVIEGWGLNFRLGNVIKYVGRSPHKGEQIKDLEKAKWYLEREIAWLKEELAREEQKMRDEGWTQTTSGYWVRYYLGSP